MRNLILCVLLFKDTLFMYIIDPLTLNAQPAVL